MRPRNTATYLAFFCLGLFLAAWGTDQNWQMALRLCVMSILCVLGMRAYDAINKEHP